jgi:N-acetylglucosamine kinase-like BadF-type ATPase
VKRAAILAVDGGGSKTDAVLLRRDGTVLGAARTRRADGHEARVPPAPSAEEQHLRSVGVAIARAAKRAGLDPDRMPVADLGVFCLAGADLPSDDRRLLRWIAGNGWAGQVVLRNDTFAILRAGTDRPWGVAVVCGFGTNCSAVAPNGRITRFPAVGPISGDWGGASDLGSWAAWYAIRAEDGRGEPTVLERIVPEHFGLNRPRQLTEALYLGRLEEERLAELAPLVFRAAVRGDAVARSLVDRQADEIVTMATTAMRRLRMTKLDSDVVLGGGIFRNRDPRFFRRIDEGLHAVAPAARTCVLHDPPVVGAAMMGLDRLDAPRAAHARARRALTHERLGGHTPATRKET